MERNGSRARVLVTDGDERSALAAARSLVSAGYAVHVAAPGRWSLGGVARGVRPERVPVSPLADPGGFVAAVADLADRVRADVVLPVTDASVEALLERRDRLPTRVRLPLPSLEAYRAASDKVGLLARAEAAGLAVPESVVLRAPGERAPRDPSLYPGVVKPHRSVTTSGGTRRKWAVTFVETPAEADAALSALGPDAFPVLVQRRIRGVGEGMFLLRWDGRILAEFGHRRLREKPPAGGVSVFRESIALEPGFRAAGRRLLAGLDWQGVAMIECRREAGTGREVVMEVNGRLWGSLQLALDAGVDFPALLVAAALGQAPASTAGYRVGVRTRWLWGDVDHLYLRLTRSPARLRLEPDAPGRLGAIRDFLRIDPRRDHVEPWSRRDPLPFLLESARRTGLFR